MKEILHLCSSSPSGGAGIAAQSICSLCNSKSYKSRILFRNNIYRRAVWFPILLALKFRRCILDLFSHILYGYNVTISFGVLLNIRVANTIRLASPLIIHLHWINAFFVPIWYIKYINRPVLWQLHDLWPFIGLHHTPPFPRSNEQSSLNLLNKIVNALFTYYVRHHIKPCFRSNQLFICVASEHMRSLLAKSSFVPHNKIHIIPLPLTIVDNYTNSDILSHSKGAQDEILFVSGQRPYDRNKNMELAVTSMMYFCKNAHLSSAIIAGRPHRNFSDNEYLSNLGFVNRQKLFNLYQQVSVVLVPSYFESFSQVAFESLISGTPVVCLKGSGVDSLPFPDLIFPADTDSRECVVDMIKKAVKAKQTLSNRLIHQRIKDHNARVKEMYISLYNLISKQHASC